MSDLTQLSDDELRTGLFAALVERIDARTHENPSLAVVTRMPAVLGVSAQGNLLTLSQGVGVRLLRGVLKWKDPQKEPRTFDVGRATIRSRLAVTPDGVAGTPDEILDWIVSTFLAQAATAEASHSVAAARVVESRTAPGSPDHQPAARGTIASRRAAPTGSRPERRPPIARPRRDARPPATETPRSTPRAIVKAHPPSPDAPRPAAAVSPAPRATANRPPPRTYQLLFAIAQRELNLAKALPAGRSRSFLIGAGVFAGLTAEAFVNDLGSQVVASWHQLQRLAPREKAEVLNMELFRTAIDWNVRPFASVAAALDFRHALAHAQAEALASDPTPRWQHHCNATTVQQWITDVRDLIDHFSRAHDSRGSALTRSTPDARPSDPSMTSKTQEP